MDAAASPDFPTLSRLTNVSRGSYRNYRSGKPGRLFRRHQAMRGRSPGRPVTGAPHRQTGTASISVGWPHSLPTVAWASARANLLPPTSRQNEIQNQNQPSGPPIRGHPPTDGPKQTLRWIAPLDGPTAANRSLGFSPGKPPHPPTSRPNEIQNQNQPSGPPIRGGHPSGATHQQTAQNQALHCMAPVGGPAAANRSLGFSPGKPPHPPTSRPNEIQNQTSLRGHPSGATHQQTAKIRLYIG